jgi:hypothetical protein
VKHITMFAIMFRWMKIDKIQILPTLISCFKSSLGRSHQSSILPSMFQLSINNNETCYDTSSYVLMAKL